MNTAKIRKILTQASLILGVNPSTCDISISTKLQVLDSCSIATVHCASQTPSIFSETSHTFPLPIFIANPLQNPPPGANTSADLPLIRRYRKYRPHRSDHFPAYSSCTKKCAYFTPLHSTRVFEYISICSDISITDWFVKAMQLIPRFISQSNVTE